MATGEHHHAACWVYHVILLPSSFYDERCYGTHLYPACVHFPWPSIRLSAPMAVMRMAQISKHRLYCWYLCFKVIANSILTVLCIILILHPFSYLHSLYVKCVVPCSMYGATMAYHLMLDSFTMYSILSHSGMIITSYIVYHVGYNIDSVHMASLAIEFMGFCKWLQQRWKLELLQVIEWSSR